MPIILALCVVGSYVVRNYMFDITCMFIFGIVGYFLANMRFPAAPFMLGLVLGTMADSNLRRALTPVSYTHLDVYKRQLYSGM